MEKNFVWLAAALATALMPGVAINLQAQTDAPQYMYGRCYKANPGKVEELREFFDTVGRTLGEESVKSGMMAAYSVIEAQVPRGRDVKCDFIATNRYTAYPTELGFASDAALKRLKIKREDIGLKLRSAGYLVESTLSRIAGAAGTGKEGAVVTVQTFKAPQRNSYEEFLRTQLQPLAQARVDAGETLGWGSSVVLIPRGADQDFNASSWTLFEDLQAQGEPAAWEQHYAKAAPGKSWSDFVAANREQRERVDSGLFVVRVLVVGQ
jgi:hypothetical protein